MAGRFKKGETPEGARPFSEATAKEMQARSVASHWAKKRGRELVQALLENGVKDQKILDALKSAGFKPSEITNELALHQRQIEKAQKTGDTKAYNAIMRLAGYAEETINVKGISPIVTKDAQDAAEMAELLDSIRKRKEGEQD